MLIERVPLQISGGDFDFWELVTTKAFLTTSIPDNSDTDCFKKVLN
jgi:hypothetical protein